VTVGAEAVQGEKRSSLRQIWVAGPYAWNQALTRPVFLVPFFLVAAAVPLVTQYFVDSYGWTGGEFWVRIAATCAMYAALALALNLAVGYAGLLNLGFIAFFGIGSYTYALVASDQLHIHLALVPALLVVVVVTMFFALLVAAPSLRLRGDYLAIVTLAFGLIMRELTLDLDRPPVLVGHQFGPTGLNLTGGTEGIHQVDPLRLPDTFPLIHGAALQSRTYYWIFLGLTALFAYFLLRWRGSRTGRAWMALREDEIAARVMGVNSYRYRLMAFAASAVMAGVVGMVDAAYIHNAFPGNYDIQQTVLVFIMVILGGLASIPGAIFGSVIVTVLPFILQPLVFYKYLIFAVILIALMIFRPQGLLGTVSMRPRRALGGTLELFAERVAPDEQEAGAASVAEVEAASGAIVAAPQRE
jgi:branched-chain amino acid transport system permease protein